MSEKMNYDDFKNAVTEEIKDFLPSSYQNWDISVKTMYKVNFAQDGLMLMPQKAEKEVWHTPTLYLKGYYEKFQSGENFSSVLKQIAETISGHTARQETENEFFKPDEESIVFQIINRGRNKELLKNLPHRDFLDLALIYRSVRFCEGRNMMSCAVTYDIMQKLQMNEEELYEHAKKQTEEFLEPQIAALMPPLYVLTNKKLIWGAASVFFPEKLKELAHRRKSDLYLLPSSLNEMMVIPTDCISAEQIHDILLQANKEAVTEEEWLSDRVYIYLKDSNGIIFAHNDSPAAYMS